MLGSTKPLIGWLREESVGQAKPYTRERTFSAIDKRSAGEVVRAELLGLLGDQQGDPRLHGGPDKAIHCYPWGNYEAWRCELPGGVAQTPLDQQGAFGENFSLDGIDEFTACIADRWSIGFTLYKVSQVRQPCWKLNDRFGAPDMAKHVQQNGRTGWYLRILKPGRVAAGNSVRLAARPHASWPVARLQRIVADRECDPTTLRAALELPSTASGEKFMRTRPDCGQVESWSSRMDGRKKD